MDPTLLPAVIPGPRLGPPVPSPQDLFFHSYSETQGTGYITHYLYPFRGSISAITPHHLSNTLHVLSLHPDTFYPHTPCNSTVYTDRPHLHTPGLPGSSFLHRASPPRGTFLYPTWTASLQVLSPPRAIGNPHGPSLYEDLLSPAAGGGFFHGFRLHRRITRPS